MTVSPPVNDHAEVARVERHRTRVGLVSGGLGAYWPQFPDPLPQLQRSAARVSERLSQLDGEVVDVGFLTTYVTATMLLPVAQRSNAPVLLLNLQPTESMDHDTFDTGQWLAYCAACPLPEMGNIFRRAGTDFRSVSGYVEGDRAWEHSDRLGGGGSFTELQALNFDVVVVEMGHDGPAHLAISSARPLLRGLGVSHGKRGYGVSVEFDVAHGPETAFGTVPGPLLQIGNTTSRVDFGCHPGEWTDKRHGVGDHWALGTGHRVAQLEALADLLHVPTTTVAL